MNQLTYIIYMILSSSIILWVGHLCYKNGEVYIVNYFSDRIHLGKSINKLLRIAYYLLNIGLSIWSLHSLQNISNTIGSVIEICNRLSFILLIIGTLHLFNIYTVYLINKYFKNQ